MYAYIRVNPEQSVDFERYLTIFNSCGYSVNKNRCIVEEVIVSKSIVYRDKFLSLVSYALEEGDSLIVKSLDCLGSCFEEILNIFNKIDKKNIKLICWDYSTKEISGDLKTFFLHFLKICVDFEKMMGAQGARINQEKVYRKVGRPEILTDIQKNKVIELFKKGYSVYALAKEFSVTRTVIQRILNKNINNNKI